jgi:hypothetical protein
LLRAHGLIVKVQKTHHYRLSALGQPEGDLFIQKGQVHLKPWCEQDVFYAVPYAGPPNLELGNDCDDFEIIEQKADHFRIRNRGFFRTAAEWTARGVRLGPCPSLAPETPPPAPALPVEPIPVHPTPVNPRANG